VTVPKDGYTSSATPAANALVVSDGGALPANTKVVSADRVVTSAAGSSHDHGGADGAAGTGNTGVANPPFVALNYLILTQ
jgi:hypothetical protein